VNSDQQWVVHSFLKSLSGLKPREPQPPHKTDVRLQLAEMVIDELPGNDLEELAHRGHAEALRDVYLTTDPNRHERYEEELCAYLDVPSPCRRLTRRIETDMQLTVTSNCYFGKIILMAGGTTDRKLGRRPVGALTVRREGHQ
jgi:hypothetical protein